MFINPQTAIDNKWIVFPNSDDTNVFDRYKQPNAIDFSLDRVMSIDTNDFILTESSKTMRDTFELDPINLYGYDSPMWEFNPDSVYDCMSNMYVSVPEGVACMIVPRSTLNRNGLMVTAGLYDSGYSGHVGFCLHNNVGNSYIAPGTRVGQIIFIVSANSGQYAGGYNHDMNTYYNHDNTRYGSK